MKLILKITLLLISVAVTASQPEYKLWYNQPAHQWVEALPLGNGRLGAMVYGGPMEDRIQLNEETIWAGQPNSNDNPNALEALPVIRDLVFKGKFVEAQNMATEKVMSNKNHGMPYQTFGDLKLSFPNHSDYTNYYRELSLDSAKAVVKYSLNGVNYKREYFTSFTDQVVYVKISADKPASISFNATLSSSHKDPVIISQKNRLSLSGVSDTHEKLRGKVKFKGEAAFINNGGKVISRDGVLSVQSADEVVILISIATNFVNYRDISGDEIASCNDYINKALDKNYKLALNDHVNFYSKFYERVSLKIGENNKNLPTELRVADYANSEDGYLIGMYYQFGRYLLICSSQPGGQAPGLQGIWNDKRFPSWDGKYTTNINTEMNYWPAENTNLADLQEPLFRLIKEISETGKETARIMYGVDGWVLHHNTDIWRTTAPVDGAAPGMWPMGAAWLCQNIWNRYLFSGDKNFLRENYPIMRSAALFLSNVAVMDPNKNWLVVCPSNSPENTHMGSNKKATIAPGTSMDIELMTDLWKQVILSSEILGIQDSLSVVLKSKLAQLPPLQIGQHGQLQEWTYDWDDPEDTHRHVSHLYGLYPSNLISPYRTPELTSAAKTTLVQRGDPSTGWSMAWKVCLWARLLDGNHANKLLKEQLSLVGPSNKGGTYPNLFDAHPPFQIDGNFGCTAGITEMLMQSQDGAIHILPALPDAWSDGEIKGIVARGGFIVDLKWSNGQIETIKIQSTIGGNCRIRTTTALQKLKIAKGVNTNPLFQTMDLMQTKFNGPLYVNPLAIKNTLMYDLPTKAGQTYIVNAK